MSKKVIIALGAAVVIVIIGSGLYLMTQFNQSKTTTPHTSAPEPSGPPKSGHLNMQHAAISITKPTQQITYPDGRKATVYANQLIARINDAQTVKSFGDTIKPTKITGVYTITVTGDLLTTADQIKQKPGVVWVTPNEIQPAHHLNP